MSCRACDSDDWPDVPEQYSDISGLGVVAGFLVTAYLVLLIILLYYVFVFDPKLDPYRSEDFPEQTVDKVNPIDRAFRRGTHIEVASFKDGGAQKVEEVFRECILALADTQIVTGIAILVSAYASLDKCLSLYHWKIAVDLAWFSSTTHLAALTLLRNHFHKHPGQRTVRLVLMGCMLVLLLVAIIPTGHLEWRGNKAAPAKCFFKLPPMGRSESGELFIPSILLVTYAYVVRAVKLFGGFSSFTARVREWVGDMATRVTNRVNQFRVARYTLFRIIVQVPVLATYVTIRFVFDFLLSMTAEVLALIIAITWRTFTLFSTRDAALDKDGWTFGQVIPLVLLLTPLLTLGGGFAPLWSVLKGPFKKQSLRYAPIPLNSPHGSQSRSRPSYFRRLLRHPDPRPQSSEEQQQRIESLLDPCRDYATHPQWFGYLLFLANVFIALDFALFFISGSYDLGGWVSNYLSWQPAVLVLLVFVGYLTEIMMWGEGLILMVTVITVPIGPVIVYYVLISSTRLAASAV